MLGELSYARLAELYAAARDAGLLRVAGRFIGGTRLPDPSDEAATRRALLLAALGEEEASATAAPTANPHYEAAPGVRIAAARGGDRPTLDRLLHDRDLRVVRALLDNPRIVERDIVRIAAMRPTTTEILEAVAAHPRWASRLLVRRAVACNPNSPHALARQLLPTLLRQDLALIVGSHVLAEPLRREAQLLLTRRSRRG